MGRLAGVRDYRSKGATTEALATKIMETYIGLSSGARPPHEVRPLPCCVFGQDTFDGCASSTWGVRMRVA